MIYKSYLVEDNLSILKETAVLFYGENFGLKDDLYKKIKKEHCNTELYSFNQDEILSDKEKFYNYLNNDSLFEEKKTFILREINDKLFNDIDYIIEKKGNNKVFLFGNLLDKELRVEENKKTINRKNQKFEINLKRMKIL